MPRRSVLRGWVHIVVGAFCLNTKSIASAATDLGTKPITVSELTKGVRASVNAPDAMVIYLRRAETCDLRMPAYTLLKKLKAEQPNNATVMGGYCFAYAIAVHGYNSHMAHGQRLEPSEALRKEVRRSIDRARRLEPQEYIAGAIDAFADVYRLGPDAKRSRLAGVGKLRKLVSAHPDNAWLRFLLGDSIRLSNPRGPNQEAHEYLRAAASGPMPIAEAALSLYVDAKIAKKPAVELERAKAKYLSLLDPKFVMPKETRDIISKQPYGHAPPGRQRRGSVTMAYLCWNTRI